MKRYEPKSVANLAGRVAESAGVVGGDAALFADALVDADLRGKPTHGVSRLNIYVQRIRKGLIKPRADLTVERKRGAVLAVDAGHGLGQVQAVKVLDILEPMARAQGVASATVRRSGHFGAVSYYGNRAAGHGMILLAGTNCEPAMSPAGGREAFFGTNPIACAFPTGKGYALSIDLATSIVARGNIIGADRRGEQIPEGWALDAEGDPTTDASRALLGTVLTMAGHKGYALAMMVEVLSGVLSGAAVGADIGSMYKNMDRPQDVGHFFCLLDVEAFMGRAVFLERIDSMIDRIKACRKRPGTDEIFVPGERSARAACENRRRGIPLGPETIEELQELCATYGLAFDLQEV